MSRYSQGFFIPKHPHKYVGVGKIKYRSSWELVFMQFCDNNDKILQWASEPMRIPYRNPLSGKPTVYVPDFLIMYQSGNKIVTELVEIKPKKQTMIQEKISNRDKLAVALNHAKWAAASNWCKKTGISFRVITEDQIFYQGRSRK